MQLEVSHVSHAYDDLVVLDDVSFTVADGEILALIGPSGCGKSTLLGIAGGLLAPTGGTVATHGEGPAGCLNPFTYIFQDFALLPWRTVAGNVALALEHQGLAPADRDRRVADGLARMGLSDFADAFPKQLSGGMRQRVGIARALVVRPAILFMDEPMSALDAQTRELLIEDFLAVWLRDKTTALYVTHNLAEALRLADRIAVFSRRPGRIRELIALDIPQAERATPAARRDLDAIHDRLWAHIRAEAVVAEREVIDA
jgi:NitT/TauT family transport system ATP-binding protein